MSSDHLSRISGELLDPVRESAFRAERLPETVGHARLLFALSAILNTLFFLSDWRFAGTPHFFVAIPARALVVGIALACWLALARPRSRRAVDAILLVWEGVNALGVAALVSSRSDLALMVSVMLPTIYYLVVPTGFRWTVAGGLTCSLMMLAGYLLPGPLPDTAIGLALALVTLNFGLGLVVARSNRLRRLEWLATRAERRAKEDLAESRTLFERMFMAVPIPLVVTRRADGHLVNANDAARDFFGADRLPSPRDTLEQLYVDPERRVALLDALDKKGRIDGFEAAIHLADGSVRDVLLAASRVSVGGSEHVISGLIDITSRRTLESHLTRLATTDPLTGLPNRVRFHEHLSRSLAEEKAEDGTLAVLCLDLDRFKEVNDTLGHPLGDALLTQVAERIRYALGTEGVVARLGGDEFAIVQRNVPQPEGARALAERIVSTLRQTFRLGDHTIKVGASLGIAITPQHGSDGDDLFRKADLALYAAKEGRNGFRFYEGGMEQALQARRRLEVEMIEALSRGEFELHYQPIMNLARGEISGFEALVRWRHPKRGMISPAEFIPVAEETHFIVPLGEWVLREACAEAATWPAHLRVAVNLSTVQVRSPGLTAVVLSALATSGLAADRLELEITETTLMEKSEEPLEFLAQLRALGVRIALDDFGTGYSSLSYLHRLPLDKVKIDRSFIESINSPHAAAIVRAIIDLGDRLGFATTGEGVETREQLDALCDIGCTEVQGYLISPPARPEEVLPLALARALPPEVAAA